jgi:hypothetical protein
MPRECPKVPGLSSSQILLSWDTTQSSCGSQISLDIWTTLELELWGIRLACPARLPLTEPCFLCSQFPPTSLYSCFSVTSAPSILFTCSFPSPSGNGVTLPPASMIFVKKQKVRQQSRDEFWSGHVYHLNPSRSPGRTYTPRSQVNNKRSQEEEP